MADADGAAVKRAVAIINAAIRHSMFPTGVMPEDDATKLTEAEKLVVLCGQAKLVADALGPTRVQNYPAVMDILTEARAASANGAGPAPGSTEAQPSTSPQSQPASQQPSPPSTSSSQAPTTSAPVTQGRPVTPSPASSASSPSPASPSSEQPQPGSVAPHPVDPDGIMAEPRLNEEWEATGGWRWLVGADHGHQVDAISRATGEQTVLPKGFLKTKMTEAFVAVEVDVEWNVQGAKGYNKIWYVHPGCVKWYSPLDDSYLPVVGSTVQCVTCDLVLPIVSVEPNGYVPRLVDHDQVQAQQPPQPVQQPQTDEVVVPEPQPVQQAHQPVFDSSTPKLNEIHLRAEPELGVKVFTHVGCSTWHLTTGGKPLSLDGKPLLPVGVKGPCPTCGDQDVPLTAVEPNGYDPATYVQPPPNSPINEQPPVVRPTGVPVFSSKDQAVVDSGTSQPIQQPQQPAQEVAPSAPQPAAQQSSSSLASPAPPPTSAPATAAQQPVVVQPSTTAQPSVPDAPSSPDSSNERSVGTPVDDVEGDAEYARVIDQAEADFLPDGMPAPQDLESPPPSMPEDLTANPEANRELHSKFNALAARARYLAKIEERIARDCGQAVRLRLRPHMAKAKKELGASSTLTERREWAEEIGGDDVRLWLDRQRRHADRSEAYGEFFSIYNQYVSVLSRDLSWAQNEERGA